MSSFTFKAIQSAGLGSSPDPTDSGSWALCFTPLLYIRVSRLLQKGEQLFPEISTNYFFLTLYKLVTTLSKLLLCYLAVEPLKVFTSPFVS